MERLFDWIPAFAGMTVRVLYMPPQVAAHFFIARCSLEQRPSVPMRAYSRRCV